MNGGTVTVLGNMHDLSARACSLLLKADSTTEVLVQTANFRWLGSREDLAGQRYFSDEQKQLEKFIEELELLEDEECPYIRVNMKVLLTSSPFNHLGTSRNHKLLKHLINAGADIRFKETDEIARIVLVKNELLISKSPDIRNLCNSGFYYYGSPLGDILLDSYRESFLKLFDSARQIGVKNNEFYYKDNLFKKVIVVYNKYEKVITLTLVIVSIVEGILLL